MVKRVYLTPRRKPKGRFRTFGNKLPVNPGEFFDQRQGGVRRQSDQVIARFNMPLGREAFLRWIEKDGKTALGLRSVLYGGTLREGVFVPASLPSEIIILPKDVYEKAAEKEPFKYRVFSGGANWVAVSAARERKTDRRKRKTDRQRKKRSPNMGRSRIGQ